MFLGVVFCSFFKYDKLDENPLPGPRDPELPPNPQVKCRYLTLGPMLLKGRGIFQWCC